MPFRLVTLGGMSVVSAYNKISFKARLALSKQLLTPSNIRRLANLPVDLADGVDDLGAPDDELMRLAVRRRIGETREQGSGEGEEHGRQHLLLDVRNDEIWEDYERKERERRGRLKLTMGMGKGEKGRLADLPDAL